MPKSVTSDDSSYEKLYERAMERLRLQAPWWTHTEVSDPGIMLIEMWALLSDMQSYYLDQVQESHYRKYLKLLGIPADQGECAWTWIFFDFEEEAAGEEHIVPKGTKLLSDEMVFETEEEIRLIHNGLQGFFPGTADNRADAMRLFRKTRFELGGGKGQERELFRFEMERPLEPGKDFRFFVLLDERGKRNAAEGSGMVRLVWEYMTADGWRKAEAVRDDTAGLLFSGIIILRFDPSMNVQKSGITAVRCRIGNGCYDVMPALYKICLNVVRVVQRDTLCCSEDVEFTESCHTVALDSYLARTGSLWFLREVEGISEQAEDGGKLWEDITENVCADGPIRAGCMERYVSYAGTGHVKIVCTAARIPLEEITKRVTGIASQRISLPWKKLMRSSVELMVRQAGYRKKRYCSYERVDPEENRYQNVWHWEEDENVIVLGDGRHGGIPSASEGGLRLVSLSLWEEEKGNVPVDRITEWQQPELFPQITCTNYLAGRGGRSRKMPSCQFAGIKEELSRQNRMVTEADIRELVMETPGLMIKKVMAEWHDNTVVVKVFPTYPLKEEYCVEWYRSQVEKHLEPYRLTGTKLRVRIETGGTGWS
ncbi:MAG: hypothetical protein K2P59_16830 [Acetatifactor sp.]|nr:hypothetical protein [Acetatifactor sp.]